MCSRKERKNNLKSIYKQRSDEIFSKCNKLAILRYQIDYNSLADELKNEIYLEVAF